MTVGCQNAVSRSHDKSITICLAAGVFWSLVGAVVSRGLTLVASIVAARTLGAAGFGELGIIQNTQGLFGVLAGAGLGLAATKFVAEYCSVDPLKASRCILLATLVSVIAGLIGASILFVYAGELAASVLKAPHLVRELQVATGLILFGAVNGVQTGVLAGLGDFRAVARLSILRGACLFFALVIGIRSAGVMGGVIGLVVTEGLAVGASQVALVRVFPLRWKDAFTGPDAVSDITTMLRFSGLAISASLATTLAFWFVNVLLVNERDGYVALGVFNAADRWRQVLLFLPAAFSPILLSMLSNMHGKNEFDGFRKLFRVSLVVNIAVVVLPALLLIQFAPQAMNLFGTEFRDGTLTLIILSFSTLAVVLNTILGQVLISKGAMGWRFAMDILLSSILSLVAWLLVPTWRELGLALAYLISYSLTAVALIVPVIWYSTEKKV